MKSNRLIPALVGALSVLALAQATPASAALATSQRSIPVDGATQLEVHTTADCIPEQGRCFFTASANLLTGGVPLGFPGDLWARQTTTVRSSDRNVYLDSTFQAENTRMFKSIGPVEFTTMYFGSGPVEKYRITGSTRPSDWKTGQVKTDSDYIVCTTIQVVYGGHNLSSPQTCSQTTF